MHTEVTVQRGTTTAADGTQLAWRCWTAPGSRACLVLVHGLAEHGGRYGRLATALAQRGWCVFCCDLRAHGESHTGSGPLVVHVDRFEDYFLDVDAAFAWIGEHHPDLPRFVLGHSMGGLIALRYVLRKPGGLRGAVLSSPALGIHPDALPPRILVPFIGLISRIAPRFRQPTGLDENTLCRDPDVVRAYIDDPLVSDTVTVRWYHEFANAIEAVHGEAGSLALPLLLMQSGDDRIVDPEAPDRWLRRVPEGLVDYVCWPGLYHELFNEPEKDEVLARTLPWLEAHL
jgi:alpha-beta hydrolase superfamily lysophospholipase